MSLAPDLRQRTLRWIADDVDPDARGELQQILADAMAGVPSAVAELSERMDHPLTFGTAGLRAPVRAGVNGMNVAVVVRTSAGVAEWLARKGSRGVVVIGRDARTGSEAFAAAAAEVFAAAGFETKLTPGPLPTPVLAYAVRALDAVAGVQITASHNPPADNGYKLYTASGGQIVPPEDAEIERCIAAVPAAVSVPRADSYTVLGDELWESYVDSAAAVGTGTARELRIALTPMHGVGGATAVETLRRAGFTDVRVVREQAVPDAGFPTVTFPNPEEPGAADLLLELARDCDADLAVALDPDADRCAIGVFDGTRWRMLRGDETGCLLGDRVLATTDAVSPLVATTLVSSSLLAPIAAAHGARYAETPTGFKWLVRAGEGLVFAYEEALGLCVDPDVVRDKDGISAAVRAADLAATAKAAGRTLLDCLDDLYRAHGVHQTGQLALRFTALEDIAGLMRKLRATPVERLLGTAVDVEDLLPDVDGLRITGTGFDQDPDARLRVVIRPSGTEPKLKAYAEIALAPNEDVPGAAAVARGLLAALLAELGEVLEG